MMPYTITPVQHIEHDPVRKISWWYAFTIFSGIILSCLITSVITLIPQHNVIEMPKFWFEFMFVLSFGWVASVSALCIMILKYWLKLDLENPLRVYLYTFLVGAISGIVTNSLYYLVWVIILNCSTPMPFNGIGTATIMCPALVVAVWFGFPKELRVDQNFQKRFRYYILTIIIIYGNTWEYVLIGQIFVIISKDYQWILALFMPLVREINGRIMTKVCLKGSGCNDYTVRLPCLHYIGARHAVFISIILGSVATKATTYIKLGGDFLIHLYVCFKTIYRLKISRSSANFEEEKDDVRKSIMKEKIECVIPIAYCLCFLMAYYGSNAEILGNIKLSIWHYNEVANVDKVIKTMTIVFFIDLLSCVVTGTFLWFFCKVNILGVLLEIQKEFWFCMAVQESYLLYEVYLLLIYHIIDIAFSLNNSVQFLN